MSENRNAMAEEEVKNHKRWRGGYRGGGSSGAIYGIGLLGAAYYFLQHATTLEGWLIGIIKAILWPGLLVYKVFQLLGM